VFWAIARRTLRLNFDPVGPQPGQSRNSASLRLLMKCNKISLSAQLRAIALRSLTCSNSDTTRPAALAQPQALLKTPKLC
jgi:hypothetical protein